MKEKEDRNREQKERMGDLDWEGGSVGWREGGKAAAGRVRRKFSTFLCVEYCVPVKPKQKGRERKKEVVQTNKKGFYKYRVEYSVAVFSSLRTPFSKARGSLSCSLRGINPGACAPFKELHIMPTFKQKNTRGSDRNQACAPPAFWLPGTPGP